MVWPLIAARRLKPPSSEEFSVLFWALIVILVLLGGILLYLSLGQPPEKLDLVHQARWTGGGLVGTAGLLLLLNWARKRFTPW